MSLERISRWVWAAAGAAVSLGIGLLRLAGSAGDFARYGECLASQKRFEAALVSEAGGRKALDGLVVFPERVQSFDGTSRPVHVVAGDGVGATGAAGLSERSPAAGVLRRGRSVLAGLGDSHPHRRRVGALVPRQPQATARDLSLRVVARAALVRQPLDGGGLVIVGGVWPSVISLLVYGTVLRPREQPGIDLRNVRPSQPPAAPPPPAGLDLSRYKADEARTPAAGESGGGPPAAPPTIPVRPLARAADETNTCQATEPAAQFDRDPDDFYRRRCGRAWCVKAIKPPSSSGGTRRWWEVSIASSSGVAGGSRMTAVSIDHLRRFGQAPAAPQGR